MLIIEYSPIEIIPLIPTNEYTILLNILIVPNKVATKSKLKRPIRSQLIAPTITRNNYTIKGWGTSPTATSNFISPGSSITLSSNITYYAITNKS